MGYWSCEGGLWSQWTRAAGGEQFERFKAARTSDAGRGCKLNSKASQTSSQATRESINQASRQAGKNGSQEEAEAQEERERRISFAQEVGVSIQTASSHLSVICLVVPVRSLSSFLRSLWLDPVVCAVYPFPVLQSVGQTNRTQQDGRGGDGRWRRDGWQRGLADWRWGVCWGGDRWGKG